MEKDQSISPHGLNSGGLSRRGFVTGAVTLAPVIGSMPVAARTVEGGQPSSFRMDLTLNVNGVDRIVTADTRSSLLDVLREELDLTGTKKGCDHGQCGACTVHIGGRNVLSCLTLAVSVREPVATIEGLRSGIEELHPLQQAFIDHDAFQCGYCTSGQIMSGLSCIQGGHTGDRAEIREFMSGNLCRCAAYSQIVDAIGAVAGHQRASREKS